ncbi:3-isopropylmalate dehydratase small subunit [Phenylobacterium sp.]|uniref:3-isopropylmalate dehydratase small subunit n=1 Tax=Phenylobacterium sp. TaxID=1871053 RepID=UPI0025DCA4AC|nr:3-isopropylmalate dehydratase small subunit [Phenylobacterium sp.]
MERFETLTGLAAPMPAANVDTDSIFPARFLLITGKRGLGRYVFYEWRAGPGGAPDPDFVLNQPRYRTAEILVAGDNFGCGSSREQACWALRDAGFRVVVSTSFGEIFHANCFKNGILPVIVSPADLARLLADAEAGAPLTVDLAAGQVLRQAGPVIAFETAPWRREALLNGWGEIDIILNRSGPALDAYEASRRAATPWLY